MLRRDCLLSEDSCSHMKTMRPSSNIQGQLKLQQKLKMKLQPGELLFLLADGQWHKRRRLPLPYLRQLLCLHGRLRP